MIARTPHASMHTMLPHSTHAHSTPCDLSPAQVQKPKKTTAPRAPAEPPAPKPTRRDAEQGVAASVQRADGSVSTELRRYPRDLSAFSPATLSTTVSASNSWLPRVMVMVMVIFSALYRGVLLPHQIGAPAWLHQVRVRVVRLSMRCAAPTCTGYPCQRCVCLNLCLSVLAAACTRLSVTCCSTRYAYGCAVRT